MGNSASSKLILVRELRLRDETRQHHARAAVRGTEVRVTRGAYVSSECWAALDERARHLLTMRAVAAKRSGDTIFCHRSAAIALGLPTFGGLPDRVDVVVPRGTGGRSGRAVIAHASRVEPEDRVLVDGLCCTSPERTAVDLAAALPLAQAVAVGDHILRMRGGARREPMTVTGKSRLLNAWLRAQPMRGHRRALDMIEFTDRRSESPLESISRVAMRSAGLLEPDLQVPFRDASGAIGYVDFAWPDHGIVGEADGDSKYLDTAMRNGRSAERVVLDEKIREDRLRALGLKVVRWRWQTASDPAALGALLAAVGVPPARDTPGLQHRPRSGKLV